MLVHLVIERGEAREVEGGARPWFRNRFDFHFTFYASSRRLLFDIDMACVENLSNK